MENILLPSTIKFEPSTRPNEGLLVVEPCFHGYGTTLGNALRRVLLSSLPGAAVIAVKVKGGTHEFQAIPNVKEDMLEIILNLKGLRLKCFSEEPTITDDSGVFEAELTVGRGRGYVPTEERIGEVNDIGTIAIDSLYSPVRNVGYRVENTRVGEITNYDKLVMTIETDGTITPEEAVTESAKILIDYFSILLQNPAATEEPSAE